ncbi:far upstream element-binding protein 1, partial [Copidosoma floridanum]|uniref:far upstream element-binding protein 1 n=1 Tax=Copidosoma floridanum TaxID=29053 RepID=UPI000C6FCB88
VFVPKAAVGLVIGKGGEMIKKLQQETGAKVTFLHLKDEAPGDRTCVISGNDENVEIARKKIQDMIDSVVKGRPNPRGFGEGNRARELVLSVVHQKRPDEQIPGANPPYPGPSPLPTTSGNPGLVEIMIPGPKVGLIIGKGGETIKQLQEKSGAKMVVIQEGPGQEQEKPLRITGDPAKKGRPNPRGNGFAGRPNEYGGWNNQQNMGNKIECSFPVPTNKCGIIIGKGGETIKHINQQTGAHCELDRRNPGTETEKYFTLKGTPEQVEHAKRVFAEKLGGGTIPQANNMYGAQNTMGYNPTWNPAYQAWPGQAPAGDPNAGQAQINPSTGQADYSAQWIVYYRSLGMHKEADQIEQQLKQQQASVPKPDMSQQQTPGANPPNPAVAAQPQPQQQPQQQQQATQQNGSQADYSAQWAEYYRSIGKIKEAEAIEAQMKSKPGNPMTNNQMGQPQQQMPNAMANPAAPTGPGAAPNAFPQAYGGYGMNPAAPGYYTPAQGPTAQPGQQNPGYPAAASYQNYQYPQQQSSDN